MDSAQKIVLSMQTAAKTAGLSIPSAHAVRQIIGISLKPAIMQLFEIYDEKIADQIVRQYKQAYTDNHHIPSPLFDGVIPLLDSLKSQQRLLAVATGKARKGLNNAWHESGTREYFISSRCADEAMSKPEPDMLKQILEELRLTPSDAVMIGDTSHDMSMAEKIGMDRIGVSYGVHAPHQLAHHSPISIIDSPIELLDHLK